MKRFYRLTVIFTALMVFSSCQWFADRFMENVLDLVESFQIYNDLDYSVSLKTNINDGGHITDGSYRMLSMDKGETINFAVTHQPMQNHPTGGSFVIHNENSIPPIIHIYDNDNNVIYSAILFTYCKEKPSFFDDAFWEHLPDSDGIGFINSVYSLPLSSIIYN